MNERPRRPHWTTLFVGSLLCLSVGAAELETADAGGEPEPVVEDGEHGEGPGGVGFLPEGVEEIPTIDEILSGNPDDDSYREGETVNCLRLRSIRRIESLDRHRALFVGSRGRVWLNEYKLRCNGHPNRSRRPMTESRGGTSSICRDDSIDWFDPMNGRFTMKINCRLGEFQEITEEQAEALKVSLEFERKAERERRRQARRERKAARQQER